jgi:ferrochelatase
MLLVSFGGPEGPDDVLPFLANVTRGRGIPRERLVEVGAHYDAFGGVSPINGQNRALLASVRADLAEHGVDLPVYWGNRNWDPYLADALRRMRDDGVRRAVAFVTSAYGSYSGCRQYREDLADAAAGAGSGPRIDKLRHYFNHPGSLRPWSRRPVRRSRSCPTTSVRVHTSRSSPTRSRSRWPRPVAQPTGRRAARTKRSTVRPPGWSPPA